MACKVLRPEYCIDFSSLEAVLEEGELLCRLRHPDVVEGYSVELEDHPRISMEYRPGLTVGDTPGDYQLPASAGRPRCCRRLPW